MFRDPALDESVDAAVLKATIRVLRHDVLMLRRELKRGYVAANGACPVCKGRRDRTRRHNQKNRDKSAAGK